MYCTMHGGSEFCATQIAWKLTGCFQPVNTLMRFWFRLSSGGVFIKSWSQLQLAFTYPSAQRERFSLTALRWLTISGWTVKVERWRMYITAHKFFFSATCFFKAAFVFPGIPQLIVPKHGIPSFNIVRREPIEKSHQCCLFCLLYCWQIRLFVLFC